MNKGQASIEALMILAAVLILAASFQAMGKSSNEDTNAIAAAKKGIQDAMTELSTEYGDDFDITSWDKIDKDFVFHVSVQGSSPPSDNLIESKTENSALEQLRKVVGTDYTVNVVVERVIK
ncbi:MAG: hypothetical protein KGY45_05010 [Hadesarchaea archaeon]|nr:hypothetical protein [Hadesarchaea archaeon]